MLAHFVYRRWGLDAIFGFVIRPITAMHLADGSDLLN
jgi:hypothetical protein